MSIYELLKKAQEGDQDCCCLTIGKFEGLIKKYAKKLSYEDAENDLICYFVELIYTLPLQKFKEGEEGRIVSYISSSIVNHYYFLLKRKIKKKNELYISEMSEEQQYMIESKLSRCDSYENLFLEDIQRELSEKEWSLLKGIYLQGLSPAEIAKIEGVTRQAVNQAKLRILIKLRRMYSLNSNTALF